METQISQKDKDKIEAGIRSKYIKVAENPEGLFKYPTGRAGLDALGYDPGLIRALPEAVTASYCGAGNPFSLGHINEGEAVLDIGCGAGVDTILAAMMVGPSGKVTGVDIIPEMLQRAEENLRMMDLKNVNFKNASGEKLPFEDNSFDVVISNSVINLIPDKVGIMTEAMRMLKPGGRLMITDQIMVGQLKKDLKARIDSWFQ
ncbi:MAG: methyltransferase domain-containing protein [Desulfobacterales bacterium]|jgi:2-polyprenyl-3-methyl-5-hydroxy-6-metoxy-1,4-benzoquinol methylase|nr:methyltransferase domain-containing protein [Desulfobacterales bacterium]